MRCWEQVKTGAVKDGGKKEEDRDRITECQKDRMSRREGDTERETEREIERETQERERQRERERERERETARERQRLRLRQTDSLTD